MEELVMLEDIYPIFLGAILALLTGTFLWVAKTLSDFIIKDRDLLLELQIRCNEYLDDIFITSKFLRSLSEGMEAEPRGLPDILRVDEITTHPGIYQFRNIELLKEYALLQLQIRRFNSDLEIVRQRHAECAERILANVPPNEEVMGHLKFMAQELDKFLAGLRTQVVEVYGSASIVIEDAGREGNVLARQVVKKMDTQHGPRFKERRRKRIEELEASFLKSRETSGKRLSQIFGGSDVPLSEGNSGERSTPG